MEKNNKSEKLEKVQRNQAGPESLQLRKYRESLRKIADELTDVDHIKISAESSSSPDSEPYNIIKVRITKNAFITTTTDVNTFVDDDDDDDLEDDDDGEYWSNI